MSELMTDDRERRRELQRRSTGANYIETLALHNLVQFAVGKAATKQQIDWAWQDLANVVAELAGPSPDPVELLLARTAAADWMAVRAYESRLAATETSREMTHQLRGHIQQAISKTHRRLLASVKMLAVVRRLALPPAPIQVVAGVANIGPRQLDGKPGREAPPC
jgi:hypothetical protein